MRIITSKYVLNKYGLKIGDTVELTQHRNPSSKIIGKIHDFDFRVSEQTGSRMSFALLAENSNIRYDFIFDFFEKNVCYLDTSEPQLYGHRYFFEKLNK